MLNNRNLIDSTTTLEIFVLLKSNYVLWYADDIDENVNKLTAMFSIPPEKGSNVDDSDA